jgi:hypothetical protein
MGAARTRTSDQGLTLDAGALIALDRGDRRILCLLQLAHADRRRIRIPAGVLGQVWRNGSRQALLARFLRARDVEVLPLDETLARAAGELCGAAGTSDVIDASVMLVARTHGDGVLTSDPGDLRKLDAGIPLQRV